jgi:predicted nucleic acid-binding protein
MKVVIDPDRVSVVLDAGPLSLITHPKASLQNEQSRSWLEELLANGVLVYVPEIADYELRRELLRAGKSESIRRLDDLEGRIGYLPLTTSVMRRAAELWARARQQRMQTADDKMLDADMILAAQSLLLSESGIEEVVVATKNAAHLSRFIRAYDWQEICVDE